MREAQAEGRSFWNFILQPSNPCHPTILVRLSRPPFWDGAIVCVKLTSTDDSFTKASKREAVLRSFTSAGAACSTTASTGKIFFEDPHGTVSLQTMSDRSIRATHPINLEPALLAQLLTGLMIHDERLGPRRTVAGVAWQISPSPVFTEDQIKFLAPLLAEGLRMAAPDEYIAYRVQTTYEGSTLESSITESTAGSLYAHGRQLFVIVSQYRYNPMRTNLVKGDIAYRSQEPFDYSGLRYFALRFTPKAALKADAPNPTTMEKSTDRFVVVDYQLLDQANRAAEARSTEALAQEVETLKQELESMKKQLDNQNLGQDSPKQKSAPLFMQ